METKKFNVKSIGNNVTNIGQIVLSFVCMVCVSSSLIGTFYVFFDIKWGFSAIALTFLFSGFAAYYMTKSEMFVFDSITEFLVFVLMECILFALYVRYAPVLELRQDQGIYMFKALNLVNYGYTYKPLPFMDELISNGIIDNIYTDYGVVQNGTLYSEGVLHSDFFPAGAFIYAIVGKISKQNIFLGQTIIVMLSGALFFFALKKILGEKFNCNISVIYIISFFLTPVLIFFGRSSFSENIALSLILFLINTLGKEKPNMFFLTIGMLSLYSARMDFMLLSIAGIVIITYFSARIGVLYSALLMLVYYIYNSSYSIYSQRIMENDLKILKFAPIMIIIILCVSVLIIRYFFDLIPKLYNSKLIKYIYIAFCVVTLCMMFRDNVGYYIGYNMENMYDQYLMTYVEFVLDLLFLAFPSLLIVGGILTLHEFLGNKNRNMMLNVFILITMTIYMMFIFTVGQAPQLYWFLRRYIYAVLPLATISFITFMSKYDFKINVIVAVYVLLMCLNLNLNSHIGVEYKNLDNDAIVIDDLWNRDGTEIVLYDSELRYGASTMVSYADLQVISIEKEDLEDVCEYIIESGYEQTKIKILSGEQNDNLLELSYWRHGERMGELPDEMHNIQVKMYEYTASEYLDAIRK